MSRTKGHAHCWHPAAGGPVTVPDGKQVDQICCWCGDTRRKEVYDDTPSQHGKFAPS